MTMFARVRTALTAVVVAVFLSSAVFAGPAQAAAPATVKAQTQRMSDATLKSRQLGSYGAGTRLSLTCSKRGQAVKGYFSKYLPNGGWDNLWYRTSDGGFVADVDIETRSNGVVVGDCGVITPPATASPPAQSVGLRVPLNGSPGIERGFGNGHNGIDYRVPTGTAVYAADAGTVAFEGPGAKNGWFTSIAGISILLRHSDKFTGYAHLSRTVIDTGQRVSKGQLIGYSGATGVVTGPHLHFEVLPLTPDFRNGYAGRIDPQPYLR